MALSAQEWKDFLLKAKIPENAIEKYTKLFIDNEIITPSHLSKEVLKELGISVLGHVLAISKEAETMEKPQASSSSSNSKYFTPKVELPRIKIQMTSAEFRKFKLDWEVYKTITNLPLNQIVPQLYSSCDAEVQNSIINTNPDFLKVEEDDIIKLVEKIVTKQANPAVHRLTFSNINQSENETINSFLVRLKSSSKDCEFECPQCKHDLSPVHIKDQLIRGLHNSQLQTDILAKWTLLKTLEDIVKHAQAFESAVRDQSNLADHSEVMRVSEYQKKKRFDSQATSNSKVPYGKSFQGNKYQKPKPTFQCSGCGSFKHGSKNRAELCPAWGSKCHNCGIPNHFASRCRKPKVQEIRDESDDELAAHVQLVGDTYTSVLSVSTMEISASITPLLKNKKVSPSTTLIFPDSGASICLAGTQHISRLGITTDDLTHCNKKVMAVGGNILTCKGWILVNFQVGNKQTQQKLFVCDNVDRIYFSRDACTEVGILPTTFPYPMDQEQISAINNETSSLPYPPREENIEKLKDHLIQSFPGVFTKSTPFPSMNCKPVHIHLKENAVPTAVHVPIPIPLHWKQEIKADLDRDVKNGIIEPVPIGEPVTWCSPMVVIPKKNGKPRRTVDLQKLNSQCLRETHHCQAPFKLACQVPKGMKKTVLDATDGYHSIPLDDESKPLTTFITEWGRFRYLRLPQGFVAAGDAYTRRYDEVIKDIENKVKCVDDTLLWARDIEQSYFQIFEYLQVCQSNGITLNKEKFQFCQDNVEFAGLNITTDGIQPSVKTLQAIKNFPKPTNITGARSWFGLINTVAWTYSMAEDMKPFRDLVKSKSQFFWDEALDKLFERSKEVIIEKSIQGIKTFDVDKATCLQTDWSRDGIGYLLLQKNCQCTENENPICCKNGWHLVFAGSRFTRDAETKYSPTEGEALAVAWSLEHAKMFVLGCKNLIISTDHKPLEGILRDRHLSTIANPRILNMKQRTLQFHFKVKYNPGKWHRGPDALSRNPAPTGTKSLVFGLFSVDESKVDEMHTEIIQEKIASILTTSSELDQAALSDKDYNLLFTTVKDGFPTTKDELEPSLKSFWNVRHRLSIESPLVMLEERIVIPNILKAKILKNLHIAHQGVNSMLGRANSSIYWPGMAADIRNTRYNCQKCNEIAPSQPKEPYCQSPSPLYPFQQICLDFFSIGHHQYLVIVDRFSGWIIIYHFRNHATGSKLVKIIREVGQVYGLPEEISSDGGPQFMSSEFQAFMKDCQIHHRLSSVDYPQSNGRAELGVKTAKRILINNTNPDGSLNNSHFMKAVLQYRNTPIPELGLSPAQILFHRQLRDSIPVSPKLYRLHKEWMISAEQREIAFAKRNKQLTADYNMHSKSLKPLSVQTSVRIQERGKWNRTGRIIEVLPKHQYRIKMDGSGRITLRNRKFLKATLILPSPSIEENEYFDPSVSGQADVVDNEDSPSSITQTDNKNIPIMEDRNCQPHQNSSRLLRRIADHNKAGLTEEGRDFRTRCLRGGKEF